MPALQARALLHGRAFVIPEDLQALAPTILAHRLMMAPGAGEPETVIQEAMVRPMEFVKGGHPKMIAFSVDKPPFADAWNPNEGPLVDLFS